MRKYAVRISINGRISEIVIQATAQANVKKVVETQYKGQKATILSVRPM